jgi:hypothetical protein
MNVCCYNHDLKFIVVYGKDNKALIYYTTNYITYVFIKKNEVQKIEKTYYKINSKDHQEKIHYLIICSLNTIGLSTRTIIIL